MSIVTPLQASHLPTPALAAPASVPATRAVPAEPAAPQASALPNPTLRLDASLGLVVLEFRDADGGSRSIPSERELEAYRSAARGVRSGSEAKGAAAPQPGAPLSDEA